MGTLADMKLETLKIRLDCDDMATLRDLCDVSRPRLTRSAMVRDLIHRAGAEMRKRLAEEEAAARLSARRKELAERRKPKPPRPVVLGLCTGCGRPRVAPASAGDTCAGCGGIGFAQTGQQQAVTLPGQET